MDDEQTGQHRAESAGFGREVAAGARRRPPAWFLPAALVGVVALVVIVGVIVLTRGARDAPAAEEPIGQSSASVEASASVSPSASASETPAASGTGSGVATASATAGVDPASLAWRETARFDAGAGVSRVSDVVGTQHGLVAVGVQFEGPLPGIGPLPPHEGRVWRSTDGTTWEDATPSGVFAGVWLEWVFVSGDAVIALGGSIGEAGYQSHTIAWQSTDLRSWEPIAIGFAGTEEALVSDFTGGTGGYLAATVDAESQSSVWLSSRGTEWELVHGPHAGVIDVAGGDEGFAIVGSDYDGTAPFGLASGDGRTWTEMPDPPAPQPSITGRGAEWYATTFEFGSQQAPIGVWSSADALSWAQVGEISGERIHVEGDVYCTEYPGPLVSTASVIVVGTHWSYPCSEGGFVTHGRQLISRDGASWTALPFPASTPGVQDSGSLVNFAVDVPNGVVLVGESNGDATFWIGERP